MCETLHLHPTPQTEGQIYGNNYNNREKDIVDHNAAVIKRCLFLYYRRRRHSHHHHRHHYHNGTNLIKIYDSSKLSFISMEMVSQIAKYDSFTKPRIILTAHITFVLHKSIHYSMTLTSHWSTKVTEPLYSDTHLCSRTSEWVKLWSLCDAQPFNLTFIPRKLFTCSN